MSYSPYLYYYILLIIIFSSIYIIINLNPDHNYLILST